MSIEVIQLVWNSTVEGPNKRHVLVVMADRADELGICWPGTAYLCRRTGISRRQVIRIREQLQDEDLILVDNERFTDAGDQDTNLYQINLEKLRGMQQPAMDYDAEREEKMKRLAAARKRRSKGSDITTPPSDLQISTAVPEERGGSDVVTPPRVVTSLGWCPDDTRGSDVVTPNTSVDPSCDPEIPPHPPASGGSPGSPAVEQPAPAAGSERCPCGKRVCRPCGFRTRAAERERTAADLLAEQQRGRDCSMCFEDSTRAANTAPRWLRRDEPGSPRPLSPSVVCDHVTPTDVVVARLAERERPPAAPRSPEVAEMPEPGVSGHARASRALAASIAARSDVGDGVAVSA